MTLIGNSEGKLHVQRQVEDYALQGNKFEEMGFLSFTVETYERRLSQRNVEENTENDNTDIFLQSNTDSTNPNCIRDQKLIIVFIVRKTIILFLISLVHGFLDVTVKMIQNHITMLQCSLS